MNKLIIATLAASSLLFTGRIAGAQTARARIADTPIRAEADLTSGIIARLKEGGPVEVVGLQGEWYRVLVPTEQGKPRVGYVLASLIEILNANESPPSLSTPPARQAQGPPIPPTVAQIAREREKAAERMQAAVELEAAKTERDAARAELEALQTDPSIVGPRASAPSPAAAQFADLRPSARPMKSASAKFFVGADLEVAALVTTPTGSLSTTESGPGLGLVLGYGFTPIWAVYANLSGADMSDVDGNSFGLGHFDVGLRAHFLSGPHIVVPFVQAGLSRRGIAQTFTTRFEQRDATASGAGLGFGGGLNVHVRPALAISAGVTWSVGHFANFTENKQTVTGESVRATTARVHVGIVWFPQTHPAKG